MRLTDRPAVVGVYDHPPPADTYEFVRVPEGFDNALFPRTMWKQARQVTELKERLADWIGSL